MTMRTLACDFSIEIKHTPIIRIADIRIEHILEIEAFIEEQQIEKQSLIPKIWP